jgi:hypothetical protein
MNSVHFIASAALGFCCFSAQAASYTSDFSGLSVGGSLAGVDGWQQSEANYSEDGSDYPWAFGTEIQPLTGPNRPAAAVGGYYNTDPAVAGRFYASHTISLTPGMLFSLNFAMIDSKSFEFGGAFFGGERNSFQVGFYDGVYEVFSLVFDPNVDPDEPNAELNPNDTWNVSASSGGIKSTASMAILESQVYGLKLSLVPNGANLDYRFSLTGNNTLSSSGSLGGLAMAEINELRVGIDPLGDQYGTNHLVFEGATEVIPEPSSLFLLAAAAGGMALRRRRH